MQSFWSHDSWCVTWLFLSKKVLGHCGGLNTWWFVLFCSSWNHHISYISSKVSKTLNLLHCHMFTCHASSKHKAFRAFVLPVLDYASTVWSPHTQKNILALEKIQLYIYHYNGGKNSAVTEFYFDVRKGTNESKRTRCWCSNTSLLMKG